MLQRMLGAATFKVTTYEEVEADTTATTQAVLVVVLVAIATGLGMSTSKEIWGTAVGVVVALVGWGLWAWITYIIGTTLFKTSATQANWAQLARTTGFAQSPGVLNIVGLATFGSEFLLSIVSLVTFVWTVAAMVVAVRQALDYRSTGQAIKVVLVAAIPYFVLIVAIAVLLPEA
ncbi:MAG: hypothetical protein HY680_08760 [Chloroflexi bacterium]|nr:hypothetical protein [Chloroflexota bacterium]